MENRQGYGVVVAARAAALYLPAPGRVLREVNSAMVSARGPSEGLVTILCAALDPARHRLSYASAGQNSPILLHDGQTRNLESAGLPLAVSQDSDYRLHRVALAPGDTLILYTDGVTDAVNVNRDFFGSARLEAVVRHHPYAPAGALLDGVLEALREFAHQAPQHDDITLLVLRRYS